MMGEADPAELPPGVAFFSDLDRMPKVTWRDILGLNFLPEWTIRLERWLMRLQDEVAGAKATQERQIEEANRLVAQASRRR